MLLTKEVEVKPTGKMIQYYKNKGYDAKWRTSLVVKIEDLPTTSHIYVNVMCDFCGKVRKIPYADYFNSTVSNRKYACSSCAHYKASETIYETYGVLSYTQTEEFLNSRKETCLQRYGTAEPSQSNVVKLKIKNTVLDRYGVENVMAIPGTLEKRNQTNLDKYGNCCPIYGGGVFEKTKETLLERYGVSHPSQSAEIREKVSNTYYKNSSQKCSKQQLYLFNLYNRGNNVVLNFPISYYNADICFIEEKIDVEYDGGFHNGKVKMGDMTQEEFDQKEIIRNNIIKRVGYKQMRIISSKDKLPSDEILLQMLSKAKQYFSDYPEHSWIEFNIDTSIIRNAEHKDGVYFDYGKLRTIK